MLAYYGIGRWFAKTGSGQSHVEYRRNNKVSFCRTAALLQLDEGEQAGGCVDREGGDCIVAAVRDVHELAVLRHKQLCCMGGLRVHAPCNNTTVQVSF